MNGKTEKSSRLLVKILLANIIIPFVFVFYNAVYDQIFNPYRPFETTLLERFFLSFSLANYAMLVVMSIIVFFIIRAYLRPLLNFIDKGTDYEKARKATIKIPWLLIIFHFSAWCLATFLFYMVSNWKTPGGIPFLWSIVTTSSSGLIGAIFTALVLNIILFPYKRELNMTSIEKNETDHFIRNKDTIILVSMIYFMTVNLGFGCRFYSFYGLDSGFAVSFEACVLINGLFFLLFFLGMHYLSRREYFLQINFIKAKLDDIKTGKGNLAKRLFLVNFDEVGDLAQNINQFIAMLENINQTILMVISNTSQLSGSLGSIITDNDSSFQSFNETVDQMVLGVTKEQDQVSTAQRAVKEIISTLSQNLESIVAQIGAVEETSTAINEMVASFYSISETARKTDDLSQGIREKTDQTTHSLKSLVSSMKEIQDSTKNILEISHVISDIAEQTNLLAINASIEASHAGKSGQGFAVVAKEIRNLSVQTAQSLNLINADISVLTKKAKDGSSAVDQMKTSINAMLPLLQAMTEQIALIAKALEEEKLASTRLMESIESFSNSARSIQELTKAQNEKGININQIMDLLKTVSEKSGELMENLKSHFFRVKENNGKLQNFFDANTENSQQLDQVVKMFQNK